MKIWTTAAVTVGMAWALAGATLPARANVVLPSVGVQSLSPEAISVSGHAEIKAQPNVAYLTIGVTTDGKTPAEATRLNATQTTTLLGALKKAGVSAGDIQTQSFYVQPQYDYRTSPAVLTGYQASNTVQVTVHDLAKAGPLLDTAAQAGATQLGDVSFDLLDKQAVQRRALAAAVQDARARAEALAAAAGIGVGRVLSLSDSTAPTVVERPFPVMRAMSAKVADAPTPIAPQQIVVSADVSVLYAIGAR